MIKIIYTYLLNLGIREENLSQNNKKIKLLNSFCVVLALILFSLILFGTIFLENYLDPLLINSLSYLFVVLTFYFQKKYKYNTARFIFLTAIISMTFISANFSAKGMLVEVCYFVYPLLALILFDNKKYPILVLIASLLLYYVPSTFVYIDNYSNDLLNKPGILLPVFIGSFFLLNYSQTLNKRNEQELDENKKELEQAYKDLELSKQNEMSTLKLESLRSQMNPHFVFNALNSIQDYIIHNQKNLASGYLGEFADLIRMYLDQSTKKEITLFEEIDTLKRYLALEKLRFEDKLNYNVSVEKNFDTNSYVVPTMLIQPFVENAIKHGLLHKKEQGNLVVSFKLNKEQNIVTCVITDDGVGRDKSKKYKKKESLSINLLQLKQHKIG